MATDKSIKQAENDKKHCIRVSLKFNKGTDGEIVEWLLRQTNTQGAIKDALLYYIQDEREGYI